jgi:hypothetical protein
MQYLAYILIIMENNSNQMYQNIIGLNVTKFQKKLNCFLT